MGYSTEPGFSVAEEHRALHRASKGLAALTLASFGLVLGSAACSRSSKGSVDPVVIKAIEPFVTNLANLGAAVSKSDLRPNLAHWRTYASDIKRGTIPYGQFEPVRIEASLDEIKAAALKLAAACDESKKALGDCRVNWQPDSK